MRSSLPLTSPKLCPWMRARPLIYWRLSHLAGVICPSSQHSCQFGFSNLATSNRAYSTFEFQVFFDLIANILINHLRPCFLRIYFPELSENREMKSINKIKYCLQRIIDSCSRLVLAISRLRTSFTTMTRVFLGRSRASYRCQCFFVGEVPVRVIGLLRVKK